MKQARNNSKKHPNKVTKKAQDTVIPTSETRRESFTEAVR
jgi:hypothetical protein